jgi:dihydroxy-acid dehydratase
MGDSPVQAADLSSVMQADSARFNQQTSIIFIGHVVPEAAVGGPLALVEDGDHIVIDASLRTIEWAVNEYEQVRRKKLWDASNKGELKVKRGILYRYARDVAVSFYVLRYTLI